MASAGGEEPFIPSTVAELTPEFVTRALRESGALPPGGRVVACEAERIGEGHGFACDVARLHLAYASDGEPGPSTLVAKLPTAIAKSRATVEMVQGYEREVSFYQELAARSRLALPRCHYAQMDADPRYESRPTGQRILERFPVWLLRGLFPLGTRFARASKRRYLVLVEDLAPARNGDQVVGCSLDEVHRAVRGLAAFHASYWADESLESKIWLPSLDTLVRGFMAVHRRTRGKFFREHADRVPQRMVDACAWMDAHCEPVMARLASPPYTVVHGDYRLDNLFFHGERVWASDFQIATRGRGTFDLAYFVAGSVDPDVDLARIFEIYLDALAANGVEGYDRADCERDFWLALIFQAYLQTSTADDSLEFGEGRGPILLDAMRRRLYARLPEPPYDELLAG